MTDEVFLTQADPMKVLPPKDNEIIGNEYGTVFMNAKTANKLLALQSVKSDTIDRVLEIIKEEQDDNFKRVSATNALVANTALEILADRVLALKGGEQG